MTAVRFLSIKYEEYRKTFDDISIRFWDLIKKRVELGATEEEAMELVEGVKRLAKQKRDFALELLNEALNEQERRK